MRPLAVSIAVDTIGTGHRCRTRCLRIEMRKPEIDTLKQFGLLRADARQDPKAIFSALYTFFDRTLGRIM